MLAKSLDLRGADSLNSQQLVGGCRPGQSERGYCPVVHDDKSGNAQAFRFCSTPLLESRGQLFLLLR